MAKVVYLPYNTSNMAYNDFKRYVWLVDYLNNVDGAIFEDIDDAWQDEPVLNPEGTPLPLRTFYNHIDAIANIFDIKIVRNPKDNKYRVKMGSDTYLERMQRSLMGSISLKNAMERYKGLEGRILYEEEPYAYPDWMQRILHAMNYGRKIQLLYRKYGDKQPSIRILEPYCLKMFKHRWYLLAQEGKDLKTFALDDRTEGVRELKETFDYPKSFNPGDFFLESYGIRTAFPETVTIKAYGNEAAYLRSTPIHSSQEEVETGKDYAIFKLFLGTDAWEFYQEILSRGDRIEILEPKHLRREIAERIDAMRNRYAEYDSF